MTKIRKMNKQIIMAIVAMAVVLCTVFSFTVPVHAGYTVVEKGELYETVEIPEKGHYENKTVTSTVYHDEVGHWETVSSGGFSDVANSSESYYKPVYWASENNIVKGFSDGTFRPSDSCTRQQFVVMIWRLAGKPASNASVSFSDINSSMSSYPAIQWAVSKGIIQGYNDGTFRPTNTVTRGQVIIMLWKMAGRPVVNGTSSFTDISGCTANTQKAIIWGNNIGVVKGYKDNTFKPDSYCLRQHIVTFLYRYTRDVLKRSVSFTDPNKTTKKWVVDTAAYDETVKTTEKVWVVDTPAHTEKKVTGYYYKLKCVAVACEKVDYFYGEGKTWDEAYSRAGYEFEKHYVAVHNSPKSTDGKYDLSDAVFIVDGKEMTYEEWRAWNHNLNP